MSSTQKVIAILGSVFGGALLMLILVAVLVGPRSGPAKQNARIETISKFRDLYHDDFVPRLQRVSIFTHWQLSDDARTVTVTVTSDWYSFNEGQKKDIAGPVYITLRNTAQAAGRDPDEMRLVIEDAWGERVARCSDFYGIDILK